MHRRGSLKVFDLTTNNKTNKMDKNQSSQLKNYFKIPKIAK